MGDADEKARRLEAQWPKECGCGRVYFRDVEQGKALSPGGGYLWSSLPFAYPHKDAYATQEARHCPCGSTLVILTEIHDLKEE